MEVGLYQYNNHAVVICTCTQWLRWLVWFLSRSLKVAQAVGEWVQEGLFLKFAEFEEKVKEVDRARAIYRYALDHIPKAQVIPDHRARCSVSHPRQIHTSSSNSRCLCVLISIGWSRLLEPEAVL